MATIKSLRIMMYVDHSRLRKGLGKAEGAVKKSAKRMGMFLAAGMAADRLGRIVVQGIQNAIKMERFGVEIAVLGGGKQMLKDLEREALASPFPIEDWMQGGKRLLGAEVPAEKVTEILKMLGNMAAGSGAKIADLGLIFTQVFAKGRLQGEEVLQFMERNVSLNKALQKTLGVTKKELQEMQEAGKITPDMALDAMREMTTGDGVFAGMMDAIMITTSGQLAAMSNIWFNLSTAFGRVILPALGLMLSVINEMIKPGTVLYRLFQVMATAVALIVGGLGVVLWLISKIDDAFYYGIIYPVRLFLKMIVAIIDFVATLLIKMIVFPMRLMVRFLRAIESAMFDVAGAILAPFELALASISSMEQGVLRTLGITKAFSGAFDGLVWAGFQVAAMMVAVFLAIMLSVGAMWLLNTGMVLFGLEELTALGLANGLAAALWKAAAAVTVMTGGMNWLLVAVIAVITALAVWLGFKMFDNLVDKFTKIREQVEETVKAAQKAGKGPSGALFNTKEAYSIISGAKREEVQLQQLRELQRINEQLKEQQEIERSRKARQYDKIVKERYMRPGKSAAGIMAVSPGAYPH